MTRRVVVVSGGLRQPSSTRLLADRLGDATRDALAAQGERAEVTVVELREVAHEITDHLLTGFASGRLAEAIESLRAADAVIVVTPVFSASYSGLFKSFFDVLDEGLLDGVPTLVAATAGTPRHSLALESAVRPLFAYLRADVVPTAVFAATEDFGGGSVLGERVERAAGELAARVTGAPRATRSADPFDDPPDFADLLAAH